jgi:hypothetical protein
VFLAPYFLMSSCFDEKKNRKLINKRQWSGKIPNIKKAGLSGSSLSTGFADVRMLL